MLRIPKDQNNGYTFLSLFSGGGGLDLGFDLAGFVHTQSSDILSYAVDTLKLNRPDWDILNCDVREYTPDFRKDLDVLLAGFPCQGFSLGGNRDINDPRNSLYKEVIRIAYLMQPRVIVMENVLNLRTMFHPMTKKPIAVQIADELNEIGYKTRFQFFRVSEYGVPQTRRRFIFIAYKDDRLDNFAFPVPQKDANIRNFIFDLAQDTSIHLPNHNPVWGFKSLVHTETHEEFDDQSLVVPVRLSRTASEGNPIRTFDMPFPAIDTATVWGWAQGNVQAIRIDKVRDADNALFIRNPDSKAKLWRISASRIRPFTAREYARLQTFPDDWQFAGKNKRELQLQIGNAVPVIFAKKIAISVRNALEVVDGKRKPILSLQLELF